ncbi:hypothetical protein F0L68_33485 [Solihabitans fulvus]|uniref:Helix-turn-helix domain-containing protein n=1 Tax=Solihabitans fulvus TaxID=1892852 RepID=A0A5B2WMR4_9PSEU|nr:hypothetical protein [Solihabitans fulvus]KAA2253323.1 hypothetical protein F0L68_33485 [Solihabitans fulvus]
MNPTEPVGRLRGRVRHDVAHRLALRWTTSGLSFARFAAQTGLRPSMARRLLSEAGVRSEGSPYLGWTDLDLTAVLAARSGGGESVTQLASETGLHPRHVARVIDSTSVWRPRRRQTYTPAPEVIELYRHGATIQVLTELTGMSSQRIRHGLRAAGVTVRPRGRSPRAPESRRS